MGGEGGETSCCQREGAPLGGHPWDGNVTDSEFAELVESVISLPLLAPSTVWPLVSDLYLTPQQGLDLARAIEVKLGEDSQDGSMPDRSYLFGHCVYARVVDVPTLDSLADPPWRGTTGYYHPSNSSDPMSRSWDAQEMNGSYWW